MSLYDYRVSMEIASKDYPFYALIMATMRKADTFNMERLQSAFPWIHEELKIRYWAPGGELSEEETRLIAEIEKDAKRFDFF